MGVRYRNILRDNKSSHNLFFQIDHFCDIKKEDNHEIFMVSKEKNLTGNKIFSGFASIKFYCKISFGFSIDGSSKYVPFVPFQFILEFKSSIISSKMNLYHLTL